MRGYNSTLHTAQEAYQDSAGPNASCLISHHCAFSPFNDSPADRITGSVSCHPSHWPHTAGVLNTSWRFDALLRKISAERCYTGRAKVLHTSKKTQGYLLLHAFRLLSCNIEPFTVCLRSGCSEDAGVFLPISSKAEAPLLTSLTRIALRQWVCST